MWTPLSPSPSRGSPERCAGPKRRPLTWECQRDALLLEVALGLGLGLLGSAAAGVGIARGYVFISWATLQSLSNYLRPGVPVTWEAAVGYSDNLAALRQHSCSPRESTPARSRTAHPDRESRCS
jgi:hypothetical protein